MLDQPVLAEAKLFISGTVFINTYESVVVAYASVYLLLLNDYSFFKKVTGILVNGGRKYMAFIKLGLSNLLLPAKS